MDITLALKDILTAGLMAPSADNHHHLRFVTSETGVHIWSSEERLFGLKGYKRTLNLVSLGAVIENIALCATEKHLRASIQLCPSITRGPLVVIEFHPVTSLPDPLHTAIPNRHTNRRFFSGPSATKEILLSINKAVQQIADCSLDWLDEHDRRNAALQLIRKAEGERFHSRDLHEEMFENIRFDVGWRQTCEEGLPPGALEVERLLRPFFRMMRRWPTMNFLNNIGAYQSLAWRAGDLPCRFAPHLGVISTSGLDDARQINTGRAFQRAWLAATLNGLAIQPMPASVLYAQRSPSGAGISQKLQAFLQTGWDTLLPGKIPLMVFRMGRAAPPSVVSARRPLESYLST